MVDFKLDRREAEDATSGFYACLCSEASKATGLTARGCCINDVKGIVNRLESTYTKRFLALN